MVPLTEENKTKLRGISDTLGNISKLLPALNSVSSSSPAPSPLKAPSLPQPTAPQENESFFSSLTGTVDKTRKTLESAYKTQIDQINKQQEASQKKIDDITDKQEALLETDVEPLLQPFREDLENKERKRLYIDENFEANQKLTNELDALLTEGNKLVSLEKERAIPNVFVTANVNKKMSDIAARAGVIEAVMNARNGQIAQAYNMIDRSVSAITADRQDRLSYYETVLNFYQNQKDEEGNRLLKLDGREETFVNEQINLLKNDLEQAETTSNYIKSLMIDPESARFMADAGVTLNDTVEQVQAKIAEQSRREEVASFKNNLVAQGYTYVPFPGGRSDVQYFDVGGQKLAFVAPPTASNSSSSLPAGAFEINAEDDVSSGLYDIERINGKLYAVPKSGDFPSFDEWIAAKEQELLMTLSPSAREQYRTEYQSDMEVARRAQALTRLSPRAADALRNPAGFYQRTATEKGEILDELANAGIDTKEISNGKKRPLSATQSDDLVQARIALEGVIKLKEKLDALHQTGPVIGRLREANPYDPQVVAIMAEINRIVPGLARGVFKEVGVLTDTDINRYTATLANPRATKEQIDQLHADTINKIETSLRLITETYSDLGYDLGQFDLESVIGSGVSDGLSDEDAYQEYLRISNQ